MVNGARKAAIRCKKNGMCVPVDAHPANSQRTNLLSKLRCVVRTVFKKLANAADSRESGCPALVLKAPGVHPGPRSQRGKV